jgi:hypothetical protein
MDGAKPPCIVIEPTLSRIIILTHGTPVHLGPKNIEADETEDPALDRSEDCIDVAV